MKSLFIETISDQKPKKEGRLSGDFIRVERSAEASTILLCDGLGSGPKAHFYARFYASRVVENLNHGESFLESCKSILEDLHAIRTENVPFSAFSAVRILPDGQGLLYSYEMPPPLLIEGSMAYSMDSRFLSISGEVVGEYLFQLTPDNALLLVSDGITQAGMGVSSGKGLGSDGLRQACDRFLLTQPINMLPARLVDYAKTLSGHTFGDDTSVLLIRGRQAHTATVLTGPPSNPGLDMEMIRLFLMGEGKKIICGSSTTEMFSREAHLQVRMNRPSSSPFDPPSYFIPGIDLVTEGCMTLNQAFNLLESGQVEVTPSNPASSLVNIFLEADIIHFLVGEAKNPGHTGNVFFTQIGLSPRSEIVSRLARKLEDLGKLAVIQRF